MQHEPRQLAMQRLSGALICLCLFVQPLLLPLHLSLEEHTHGLARTMVGISVDAHRHGHAHPHSHPQAPSQKHSRIASEDLGDSHPSHPSHPAEDHLALEQQLRTPPSPDFESMAIVPALASLLCDAAPPSLLSQCDPGIPQRPPSRAHAQPRAPPSIV